MTTAITATYYSPLSTTYLSPTSPTSSVNRASYPLHKTDEVPSAVKNLLLSTKRLQEVLCLWSVGQATEGDVSDLYVQIGNEFNVTINAFAQHEIDLSDIHSIPADLRVVLEGCLSEDPSSRVLEKFMPKLRRVLFNLLQGLQSRQESWQLATQSPRHSSSRPSSANLQQ